MLHFHTHDDSRPTPLVPRVSFSYTNEASGSRSFRAELLWSGIHRRAEAQDVRHPKPAISRLFLFESGFAEAECAAGKFRLAPGRIHLLPQGQDFRIRYSAGSVLYHWHLSVVNALGFPLFSKVRGIPCLKDRPRFVKDLIDARQADDAGLWHGLLFQVVLYFSKLEASHSTLDPLSASPLSPVLEYVHSHPHVSCTVEFLSGKFSIPRRELSLGFRKVMGVPLKKYLLQVQLRRAKELLSNQELSVEAIALTLGFEHPTYFYRFFKRGAAVTPNTYRRAQKS